MGGLADRLGRKRMLISGSVLSGIGALLTSVSESYILITLGIFLVGLGWSAAIVTSTALIADVTPPLVRGRILGIIEMVSGIFSLAFPIVGGLIASLSGFMVLGVVGLLATIPCLAAAVFLKEKAPAVYEHRYPHLGTSE